MTISRKKRYKLRQWWVSFIAGVVMVLTLALFAVRFFFVTGSSMKRTLYPGDFVFVNKLAYGPRLPMIPLGVPYSNDWYVDEVSLPYRRLPGFDEPRRNDVVAFNDPRPKDPSQPVEKRKVLIKRLVGLPGDTFKIRNKAIIVNGDTLAKPPGIQYNFHLKVRHNGPIDTILRHFSIDLAGRLSNRGDWLMATTRNIADSLEALEEVAYTEEWTDEERTFSSVIFPEDSAYQWSLDHFGPLRIPARGDSILLNKRNLSLYRSCITDHEKTLLAVKDSDVFVNGSKKERYGFEMDYYFVVGDDRHNSHDSRSWGFVPESHLIGRASFILFSFTGKRNEESLLKKVSFSRSFKGL